MRDVPEIEEWRTIAEWPDYAVSNLGRIKRITDYRHAKAGRVRKLQLQATGYWSVNLTNRHGGRQTKTVHSLVAEAFLGPRPFPDWEVNHKDTNRANPRLDNLEWGSKSYNRKYGYEFGLATATGEANGYSKLTEAAVLDIRANGGHGKWDELAARHGVSSPTVRDVFTRRTWTHI
jgi:hypothetical protein